MTDFEEITLQAVKALEKSGLLAGVTVTDDFDGAPVKTPIEKPYIAVGISDAEYFLPRYGGVNADGEVYKSAVTAVLCLGLYAPAKGGGKKCRELFGRTAQALLFCKDFSVKSIKYKGPCYDGITGGLCAKAFADIAFTAESLTADEGAVINDIKVRRVVK